jgi:DNA replication and repair protein RecF
MILSNLQLQNFRSFRKKELKFSSGTTLVVGPNTSGKTNLLEAIYLLATGKSFRAGVEAEMIHYGQEVARVKGQVKGEEGRDNLEIVLTTGQVGGERAAKKRYLLNGNGKRMVDFVGQLRCVLFGPEDLEIIINSPSIRRDYLDSVLEQVDRDYRRASLSYKKGLRQRNKLLEQIRDEGKPRSILFFWDKLLLENGAVITQKREAFLNFVNEQPDYFGQLNLGYDKSIISPQRLEKYEKAEVAAGITLVGPHRDDFVVGIKNQESGIRNLHRYGSRGEQRTAVFSLKLAELEFFAEKTNERPVLLLDDIFSELDHERRGHLLEVIPKQQTIMTTTDIHLVDPAYRRKVQIIELR